MLSSYASYTGYTAESVLKRSLEEEEDMVLCSPAKRGHFSALPQEQAGFAYTQHNGWQMMQQPLFNLGFEAEHQSFYSQPEQREQLQEADVMQQRTHALQAEQCNGVQASITSFFRPAAVASSSRRRALNHGFHTQEQEQAQAQEQQMDTVSCSACIAPSMTDTSFTTSCAFCERVVCGNCIRECSGCQQGFCTFCCTTTYDSTFERVACFACAQESRL